MNCEAFQKRIPAYVEGHLSAEERAECDAHVPECLACARRVRESSRLRGALRGLPRMNPPEALQVQLHVMASRERVRYLRNRNWASRLAYWGSVARLMADNLMRPLLVPLTGGVATALFLFGGLVPSLNQQRIVENDVPLRLFEHAAVEAMPDFASRQPLDDLLVEVLIDNQGRLVNYDVRVGEMDADLGNMLLFTTYSPARMFGQPMRGRILLRRSRIVVKG
ncbi:MAG: zf-HC2 domain-containing protein [Bryobacterales bacterium]|nr:zf-HC2 domain-containing protein [Bryobacterales bacterium]